MINEFNNEKTEKIFKDIISCSELLNCNAYIYGTFIWQTMLKNDKYNPQNLISVIFDTEKKENDKFKKIFPNLLAYDSNSEFFMSDNFKIHTIYLKDFNPNKVNSVSGFTTSQIYYDIKTEKLIDSSGSGIKHLLSKPIIIKSTSDFENWIWEDFIFILGTFYDSKIDEEDEANLIKLSIEKFEDLDFLFYMNRPGTAIDCLIRLFPSSKNSLFNQILSICGSSNILINENINIKEVFSVEKLKLLDLYSDYFKTSNIPIDERLKTLIRILVE